MAIQRMDHVGVVADDLEAAIAFFAELGLQLDGETTVEGRSPSSSAEPPPHGGPASQIKTRIVISNGPWLHPDRPPSRNRGDIGETDHRQPPLALPEGRPAPR